MGPFSATQSVIFNYFRLNGRATRSEYWWWALIQSVLLGLFIYSDLRHFIGLSPAQMDALGMEEFMAMLGTSSLWFCGLTIIPNFTVTIRRLHDSGRSGFWFLINIIPFIGPLVHLFFMLCPSQRDDNIWGQPPGGGGSGPSKDEFSRAMQSYAVLDQIRQPPSPERMAARKQEISEYYRTRVAPGAKG